MRWVGITGKAGAGKDYLASQLIDTHPAFVRMSFASALREEIEEVLGVDIPELYKKPTHPDVRRLLQWWGTDFRRAEDPDYWVKRAEEKARSAAAQGLIPVFTDVRFPNEADMIVRNGGLIVRVSARKSVRRKRLGVLPMAHASETAMDDYPVKVKISSNVDDMIYQLQVSSIAELALGE